MEHRPPPTSLCPLCTVAYCGVALADPAWHRLARHGPALSHQETLQLPGEDPVRPEESQAQRIPALWLRSPQMNLALLTLYITCPSRLARRQHLGAVRLGWTRKKVPTEAKGPPRWWQQTEPSGVVAPDSTQHPLY